MLLYPKKCLRDKPFLYRGILFRKSLREGGLSKPSQKRPEFYLGGDPGPKGAQLPKIGVFGGIQLQIFGAEGVENFEKLRF